MTAMSNTGISRRGFIKAAGAAGVLAVSAGGMATASDWLRPAIADETPAEDKVAFTYHHNHCGSMCPLKCTVHDGRLVLIEPNDMASERRYQVCCLKGLSEVQHIYGEGRVQTPLRRVGERGENSFEAISWDEALDEIAAKLKEIQGKYGDASVMATNGAEADAGFLAPMLGACSAPLNSGIDIGTGNGSDPAVGMGWGYAMCNPEARDWAKSKLVLISGSNFCESSLTTAICLAEAREAGARVVTVDPHFSTTAGKSDQWIPIEPGTDAALFLGMISHIIDNKLYDEKFCIEHTALPFLVSMKTGKLVYAKEPAVDAASGYELTGQKDLYYVVSDGKAAVYADAKNIKLSGAATVNGEKCCTVFDLLKKNQKQYTTEWAAEITGIDQGTIESLAEEYAAGPSSLSVGWGGWDKISNADIGGHAAILMVALTGNIGAEGTGYGVYVGGSYTGYAAGLGGWTLPETMVPGSTDVALYDMPTKENNVHAWISMGDAYIQRMANCTSAEDWIKSLDLIVQADPYFTESCKWADYVLPLTTRFEYDEDFGNIMNGYSHIVMQQKILDPLFEAKTDLTFIRELAKRLGRDKGLPETARERADAILATSADPWVIESGLTVEKLAEHQGIWPAAKDIKTVRRVVTDLNFATRSGNMDVYYENLVSFNQALPNYEQPLEVYKDNPDREQMPYALTNTRTRFRIHNQFNDSKWLQELYVPTVDVNPADLEGTGIQNGDIVELKNERGSFKVPVHLNEAIRPGACRIYEAATSDYTAEGNMQSVTNNTRIERGYSLMMGPVAPFSDTIVSIEKA